MYKRQLVGLGIPEYEAKRYEGAVKGGGTLLSVHCDTSEEIDVAKDSLKETGAQDIASTSESGSKDKPETVETYPAKADNPLLTEKFREREIEVDDPVVRR